MTLESLIELARETAGSEWQAVAETAEPLALADMPGEIVVGHNFYGAALVDGWHRVAGLSRQEPLDTEVPVKELSESETADALI